MEHLLGSYNAEETRLLDTVKKEDIDDIGLFTSMLGQIKELLDKPELKEVFQSSNHNEDKITVQSYVSNLVGGKFYSTHSFHVNTYCKKGEKHSKFPEKAEKHGHVNLKLFRNIKVFLRDLVCPPVHRLPSTSVK